MRSKSSASSHWAGRAHRDADGEVRRDVEGAFLREQALVVVEVAHADLGRVRGADRQVVGQLAHVADPGAETPRTAVAVVGDAAHAGRQHRVVERLQALGLEALVGDDRRNPDRMALHELPRHIGRNHQLHEVDTQAVVATHQVVRAWFRVESGAGALRRNLAAGVVGVHSTVAEDGEAEGEVRLILPVDRELGDEEVRAAAVGVAVDVRIAPSRTATRRDAG